MKKVLVDRFTPGITITYFSHRTLGELISKLEDIKNSGTPDTAKINWQIDGYDDDELHINFEYKTEETDEEYNKRIEQEKTKEWHEKRERKLMYEILKREFEQEENK